jgi:hypothetical protein
MAMTLHGNDELAIIDSFVSRECRNELHYKCARSWRGLGFEVKCRCPCHISLTDASSCERENGVPDRSGHNRELPNYDRL